MPLAWHSSEGASVEPRSRVAAAADSQPAVASARLQPHSPPAAVTAAPSPDLHVVQPEGLPPRPEPRFTMPELLLRHVQERRRQLSQQG